MGKGRVVVRGLYILFAVFFAFLALSWVFFYVQGLYQKRRTEALIKELRTFPFASATFEQVRDLTLRYRGSSYPVPQLPANGNKPSCNVQNCTFLVWIKTGLIQFPLTGKTADFFYAEAHLLGIRSWGAGATFAFDADKLRRSSFSVGEFRQGECLTSNDLIEWGYSVRSRDYGTDQPYSVGFLHVSGPPSYNFVASFAPEPGPPRQSLFDINLDCLTTPFRDCRDMGELAPSAWADYQAQLTAPDNAECH